MENLILIQVNEVVLQYINCIHGIW